MHPAIPLLLELQKTDQEMSALRADLETAPKRIREADSKLTGARSAAGAAKAAHTQALAARKKAELDVAEWREKARKFRAQSSAVKTNEAFKALQHEISNADAETARAEDAQLEQMMAKGEIRYSKIGRVVRFNRADVLALVPAHQPPTGGAA